jgi:signal transduction histidine kinase
MGFNCVAPLNSNTEDGLAIRGSGGLGEAFASFLKNSGLLSRTRVRVCVHGREMALSPDLRDEIYCIGREAISNACRHSLASNIDIDIEYRATQLRLTVCDNGCGIDIERLPASRYGYWGLHGMRERAERIGAKLRVLSRAAAGTEIELSVPSRLGFEPKPLGRPNAWLSRLYARS